MLPAHEHATMGTHKYAHKPGWLQRRPWLQQQQQVLVNEVSKVKHSACSATFVWEGAKTIGLILFYYVFSISLTFYNKKFISAYPFPLSITMTHLVTKFVLALFIREVWTACSGKDRTTLDWWQYIKRVGPPGIASSMDIALSNWSFEYITISLYTMTKTTVIIFIMAFSILFGLEKPRLRLIFIVPLIALGLFMFVFESTQFNLTGFLLVLSASFISGLRWSLSQLVLQKSEIGLSHPLDMMYHIQPWMIVSLLPLSAGFEGVHVATSQTTFHFQQTPILFQHLAILFSGALLAFMLELSEFLLVSRTSGITLSISGIVKEICTLVLAGLLNGDRMTSLNVIGLFICLAGITLHIVLKSIQDSDEKMLDESVQMLIRNGEANPGTEDEEEDEVDLFNVQRDR